MITPRSPASDRNVNPADFLQVITEHFGEIEATRISKLFAVIMVAHFSFEEGLNRIE